MSNKITVDEMTDSLTGFEEVAIAKHFEADWMQLMETRPTMLLRALVFTQLARGEVKAAEAKAEAMGMPLSEVNDFFATDEDEPMPEDPVTESGKDDSQPE